MSDSAEAAERALRTLQGEASGSSCAPLLSTRIERSLSPPLRASSPDQTCAICLGEINDESVTDSCFHRFCFTCLCEWSKIKPECPLCKVRFTAIYHGIKSMKDYQVHRLDQNRNLPPGLDSLAASLDPHIFINVAVRRAFGPARFGYRTTMGLNRASPLNRSSFAALSRGPPSHYIWGPPGALEDPYIPHSRHGLPLPQRSGPRSLILGSDRPTHPAPSGSSTSARRFLRNEGLDARKNIYQQNLWARPSPEQDRIRESSPEFYRANSAQIHRLVPWLLRELTALSDLGDGLQLDRICLDSILSWITRYPINSADMKRNLQPYLGANTDHFVHEFYHFATSPFDMLAYDTQARYTPTTAEQEASQNASEDDMEIEQFPVLPFNLPMPPIGQDHMASVRTCMPMGRPTRNISGRSSSQFNLDLQSFLFPSSVINRPNLPAPGVPPEVIVLSSGEENEANESADSDSEVQIIGSLPPLHLRPPEEVIDLDDSNDSDVIEVKPPTPPLITIDDDNDDPPPQSAPSTSNGVAGPSGTRADGLRSQGRFFRPSYREYSSTSDDEVLSPKKRLSKKKTGRATKTSRSSSKRNRGPKSSKFVYTESDTSQSCGKDNEISKEKPSKRKSSKGSKRRYKSEHTSSGQEPIDENVGQKRKSLKSSKKHDFNKTCKEGLPSNSVVETSSGQSDDRPRRKHKRSRSSSSSSNESCPRKQRKHHKKRNRGSSRSSSSSGTSKGQMSSGYSDSCYVKGANLAVNPKAISKKEFLVSRWANDKKLQNDRTNSRESPPGYWYGEMVELRSPTYCSMVLDNQVEFANRRKSRVDPSENSNSSSSSTLSIGTESAPSRHVEWLQSVSQSLPGSPRSFDGNRPVDSSPKADPARLSSLSPSETKPTLKSDSIPSGPPSIVSPSSDTSGSDCSNSLRSSPTHDWPDLSEPQSAPTHSPARSPPKLSLFYDSPLILLDNSPIGSPPRESSSWDSSLGSPPSSPPRLKSVISSVSPQPSPTYSPLSRSSSVNTSSDEEDSQQT